MDRRRRSVPTRDGWCLHPRVRLASFGQCLGSFRQYASPSPLVPSPLAGEGTMVRSRTGMGEGFVANKHPSPIMARGNTELPSPARGEGT